MSDGCKEAVEKAPDAKEKGPIVTAIREGLCHAFSATLTPGPVAMAISGATQDAKAEPPKKAPSPAPQVQTPSGP